MATERPMQKIFGKNKGKLHRRLNVPEGEKIPAVKLAKASHSKDPTLRREVAAARMGSRISKNAAKRRHHHAVGHHESGKSWG